MIPSSKDDFARPMIMEHAPIQIYLSPELDTTAYPTSLSGDFHMSVDYKIESAWIFYLMLKGEGFSVQICRKYPSSGILMIHKAYTQKFVWNPELFVVSMQWDHKRDDRGQVHLVSSVYQTRPGASGWMDRLSFSGLRCFAPPPMHPQLTSRNPERGRLFETVAFVGAEKNLEAEFRTSEFKDRVAELGMKFRIINDPDKMSDYSEIDAILAARNFGKRVSHKPAQKLTNAWRAGVPALLGCEEGYRELRYSHLDYLEVKSVDEAVAGLKRLKEDVEFREAVIENGLRKSDFHTINAVQSLWADVFRTQIFPAYEVWKAQSTLSRFKFLVARRIRDIVRFILSFIWHRLFKIKPKL